MADKTQTGEVTNTAKGIRGLHTVEGYQEFQPGQTLTVELSEAEYTSAKRTGYFAFGKAAAERAAEGADDDLDVTVPNLKKLAVAEGIDLGDANTKAEIQGAIRKARAEKAAAGDAGGQPDDLDNMSDADLRTTVQAITGTEPAADATREQLLKLARGEGDS